MYLSPTVYKGLRAFLADPFKRASKWLNHVQMVLKAQKVSAAQFVTKFASTIHDHDFIKGSLVLVRNSRVEKELNWKTKAC